MSRDGLPTQEGKLRSWVLVLAVSTFALAIVLLLVSVVFNEQLGFAALGLALTAVSWLPFAVSSQRFFSLWGFLGLSVTGAAGIRGIMLAFDLPTKDVVNSMFLRGSRFSELLVPAALALAVMMGLTAGYLIGGRSRSHPFSKLPQVPRLPRVKEVSESWIVMVALTYALFGGAATYAYYLAVGGLDAGITARRTTVPGLQPTSQFQSFGHLEILGQAGHVAFVLLLFFWLRRRPHLGILRVLVLLLLLANAVALNYVTTTREPVLRLGLASITAFGLARNRIPVRMTVITLLVAVTGIAVLSAERSGGMTAGQSWVGLASESILVNRNSFDLAKTLLIIDAVPDRLPLQYGKTISAYLSAPIPRVIWPDKPIISPGLTVGRSLYGTTLTGVPPGLIAELVWNFGAVAAVVLSIFVGIGLHVLNSKFYPRDVEDLSGVLVYLLVVVNFGQDLIGTSIGAACVTALVFWFLLLPLRLVARLSLK